MNDRMCIVTRRAGEADDLIRFVAGPNGDVVPDLKRQLPGRGCWVSVDHTAVEKAVAKNMFAKALKSAVKPSSDLPQMVDRLLMDQVLGMMAMARKAGQFVTGSTKVDIAVRTGEALAVFHASDAAADGVRKIDQARKAMALGADIHIPAFHLFNADEMATHLGDGALIHAAALAGQAGEGVVKRATMLQRYRHIEGRSQVGS
ncbi:RNA-binding protein [Pararhizobium haloflavum]|uniref:RNA-binding protein n=1 Tax=Pararhizobium haloflavum TaxID=2037914 RepID=UPI000C191CDA|nr:RNA-binding protein [Pararhizobium haloflavum]